MDERSRSHWSRLPSWTISNGTRSSSAACCANARPTRRVRDTLATLGFAADSIRSVAFGVEPNYDFERGHRLINYEARTVLTVRLRELDRLGSLLDAVLAAGATTIREVQFESDTLETARRHALGQALRAAQQDADALARAAGGRLGRLLQVTTTPPPAFPYGVELY